MKRSMPLFMITLLGLAAGCGGPGSKATVTDAEGRKLDVVVAPNGEKVIQGEVKKFSVSIRRENFSRPVLLEFGPPPTGVTIKGKTEIAADENDVILTLKAAEDAPLGTNLPIKVTARVEDTTTKTIVTLKVTVEESLENKKARKKTFETKSKKRLVSAEKELKRIEAQLKNASEAFKKNFYKTLSRRTDDLKQAKEKLVQLEAEPLDTWERRQPEVDNAIRNLESNVSQAAKQLENNLKEK